MEFTVQLLQLVHGQHRRGRPAARDPAGAPARSPRAATSAASRRPSSPRTTACCGCSSTGSSCGGSRRTHLMPEDPAELRLLARGSGLAPDADELVERWTRVQVAGPRAARAAVLPAAAQRRGRACPPTTCTLTSEAGGGPAREHRLPRPARRAGAHRRPDRRGLAPRDDPAHPAAGDAAVVRGGTGSGSGPARVPAPLATTSATRHWYLRMLRDSARAARRLTRVLSGSRFVIGLLETHPGGRRVAGARRGPAAAAAVERCARRPRRRSCGTPTRDAAAAALRTARRREVLRLALGGDPRPPQRRRRSGRRSPT